jgi:HEAT repeat protein
VDLFLAEETIELPGELPAGREPGSGELSAVGGAGLPREDADDGEDAAPAGEPLRLGAAPMDETVRVADPEGERRAGVREVLESGAEGAVVRITPGDFDPTLYFLEPDEVRRLREEVEESKERNLLLDYLELLRELILLDAASDDAEPITALEELFAAFFASADLATVVRVHALAGELRAEASLSAPKAAALARLAGGLLDPANLARLSALADDAGQDESEREALAACLARAAESDLGAVVERLGDLKRLAHREELLAPLAEAAARNPAALRRLFRHADAAVVRNALFLAGRAGAAAAPEALAEPLRSPDAEVRIEAVHALKAHRTPEALALLVRAVEDPDKLVRYYALRNLVASGYRPALRAVEAAIDDRAFAAKDLTEKKLLFEALGRFAGAAAVPRLRALLGRRGMFRRGDVRELRVCAAVGLGEIATPDARALLEEHARDRDPDVREACEQALARMRR